MADRIHRPAGSHLLADLSGIEAALLTDCGTLERLLREAAEAAGARVLHSHFHGFGVGMGVTGVVLLAESHISIHTWPEDGFAAADIFMCGAARPQLALDLIQAALAPHSRVLHTVRRAPCDAQTTERLKNNAIMRDFSTGK
jgi:S-adenosylmethionine decarboxylase